VGEVALWGRLVETERGWRGSAAYPIRLFVPDDEIARGLEPYEVPIFTTDVRQPRTRSSARSRKSVSTRL
jgi:hypothetical protein